MSGQSKSHSLLEAVAGTAIGFVVALTSQMVIYPAFGMTVSFRTNLALTTVFTAISVVRSYFVRRLFNWWHARAGL